MDDRDVLKDRKSINEIWCLGGWEITCSGLCLDSLYKPRELTDQCLDGGRTALDLGSVMDFNEVEISNRHRNTDQW